jgi:outer membrane protein assembly factor BamB
MKNLSRCSLFAFAIVAGIGIANGAEIPSTSEPAWAMFQHDPSHTSRSSLHAASNPGTRKWEFFTNKGLPETSPAVASDETIYLGADDYLQNMGGELFAVNSDGTLKWKFATPGGVRFSPAIGTDGTIYFGANECGQKSSWLSFGSHSCLYALSPEGKLKWQFNIDDTLSASSPIIGSDGTIYIGNDGGALFAINRDGTVKWKYGTGGAVGVPAIGANGTIYVNSKDGNLYAINAISTLKWKFLIGDEGLPASPAIGADGTIFVGSYHEGGRGAEEHYVYAIKPSGDQKWKLPTDGVVMSAPAIAEDGTIYVTGGLHFYAISPDGARKRELPIRPRSAPAIGSDGTIYFESFPAEFKGVGEMFSLFAINPDGSIKWHTPMDNQVSGSPAIGDDGTVYLASEDGKLSAFGQATASVSAPASLDFGSSPLWNTVTKTFTIANTSSVDLFIKGVELSNHCGFRDFTLGASTCPPGRLARGLSCAIAVTFSPLATGSRSAPLTITDNAGSGSQTVTLTGTGTSDLTMSAETLGWNRVKAGSSSSKSITIANHQTIPVALSTSIGGASDHDFSISQGSCKNRLAANSSCTIEVNFSPATPGNKSAYLSISGNPDASSSYRVTLTGSGI